MLQSRFLIDMVAVATAGIVAAATSSLATVPTPGMVPAYALILVFLAFWPVALLAIRRAREHAASAAIGPVLYAGLVLAVMSAGFAKPFPAPLFVSVGLAAMLIAWLMIEASRMSSAQKRQPLPVLNSTPLPASG